MKVCRTNYGVCVCEEEVSEYGALKWGKGLNMNAGRYKGFIKHDTL